MNELTSKEEISQATHQINIMCGQIEGIQKGFLSIGEQNNPKILDKIDNVLKTVAKTQIALMNDIAEFMNDNNMVTELDVKLSEPVFEVLNNTL